MRNYFLTLTLLATICWNSAFGQQTGEPAVADGNFPIMDYDNPQRYYIKDILISGVQFLDTERQLSIAGINRGDSAYIPGNYISSAVTKLWNMRYFSDVDVRAEKAGGDDVILHVTLKERPRVHTWSFEGIPKGQANDLKEKLRIERGGSELSDYVIDKNVRLIKEFYIEKGFRNVEVEVRIDNKPTGAADNFVNVTFVVDRKERVKIKSIAFEGNEEFSDSRLRRSMKKTKQKSINIFASAKLKEKEYEDDLGRLIDFYNSKGYRNAIVTHDSIYELNMNLGIRIGVEEGRKFYYRNITWIGNSVYDTETLSNALGIESGDHYDKKTMEKRLGIGAEADPQDPYTVSSLYQNNGYLFSQIEPSETVIGEDSIDLAIKILEGRQARLNEITITGNNTVDDEVIRRELYTLPGELYNRHLIVSTINKLAMMQHFSPEAIAPDIRPVTGRDLVDISWNLEETASDRAEISGGWGAGMFVGSIGLTLNNVSLRDFLKSDKWKPYPRGRNQSLSIRAQSNGSYYKAFSLSFTEPWLGGKKPNSLTVSLHYSDETNASWITKKGTKHFRTMGASAGVGRMLSWPDPNFSLYTELSYQAYNLKDWDYFIINNGTSNLLTFTTIFARNTFDQPIFPTSGSEFSISLAVTPPYSLFDGRDYSDQDMSENDRYRWIEYHKWKLKGQWYFPLPAKFVLMTKAEMGYLGAYNEHKRSPFEGFDMGGDGMSGYNVYGVDIVSLRGYDNGSLTPLSDAGDYARLYNKYTVEVRYPIVVTPTTSVHAIAFAEGGNAFSEWKKFNPFQLKRSLGFGLRMYMPMLGTMGVDWGYGFDVAPGQTTRPGGQVHYILGTQF